MLTLHTILSILEYFKFIVLAAQSTVLLFWFTVTALFFLISKVSVANEDSGTVIEPECVDKKLFIERVFHI